MAPPWIAGLSGGWSYGFREEFGTDDPSRIRQALTKQGWRCRQPERLAEATLAREEWWKKWPWMKTRYTT